MMQGEPVIGAIVSIKGTTLVTITDNDGAFYFPAAPAIAQLIVSGAEVDGTSYTSRDLAPVLITVPVKINALNETIVKGYYATPGKIIRVVSAKLPPTRFPLNQFLIRFLPYKEEHPVY